MPIALAYSCQERKIANLYSLPHIPIVPMTKIKTDIGADYKPGFERFEELIDKRLARAGAKKEEVFGDNVCDQLIELSGGQPRELMTLIRESIAGGELPISSSSVERATRKIQHAYARLLQREHWDIIEQVKESHSFERTDELDKYWMDLLDSRAVLQYVNDKEWYALNPLVPDRNQ